MRPEEILQSVVEAVSETMGKDEPVETSAVLYDDLGFNSMDYLDFLFRLEDRFDLEIDVNESLLLDLICEGAEPKTIYVDGVLTEQGRTRLVAFLHDTPPDSFPNEIRTFELYRFCTVAAIARAIEIRLSRRVEGWKIPQKS